MRWNRSRATRLGSARELGSACCDCCSSGRDWTAHPGARSVDGDRVAATAQRARAAPLIASLRVQRHAAATDQPSRDAAPTPCSKRGGPRHPMPRASRDGCNPLAVGWVVPCADATPAMSRQTLRSVRPADRGAAIVLEPPVRRLGGPSNHVGRATITARRAPTSRADP